MNLSPEQQKIADYNKPGALSVKGIAGSGKTLVGIERFKKLLSATSGEGGKVLFVTFQKTLVNYIKFLAEKEQENNSLIWSVDGNYDIINIDSLMHNEYLNSEIVKRERLPSVTINERDRKEVFLEALNIVRSKYGNIKILNGDNFNFLMQEVDYINNCNIFSLEYYQVFDRAGQMSNNRIKRLKKKSLEREAIFKLRTHYGRLLVRKYHKVDWPIKRMIAYSHAKKNPKNYYTHLIIDESQDLSRVQIDFLKYFIDFNKRNATATFLYDSRQSIYLSSWLGKGKTFKSLGIPVVGKALHKNFRTTYEIQKAAQKLFNDTESLEFINKTGVKPFFAEFSNKEDQNKYVLDVVNTLTKDFRLNDIIITSRTNNELSLLKQFLNESGIEANIVGKDATSFKVNQIRLMTLHAIKGIESDIVIVANFNEGSIPHRSKKLEEEKDVERRLLYVGMTRAKKFLYLVSSGVKSSFIEDLAIENLEVVDVQKWQNHEIVPESPELRRKILDYNNRFDKISDKLENLLVSDQKKELALLSLSKCIVEFDRLRQELFIEQKEIKEGSSVYSIFIGLIEKLNTGIKRIETKLSGPEVDFTRIKQECHNRFANFTPTSIESLASAKLLDELTPESLKNTIDWSGVIVYISRSVEKELRRVLVERFKLKVGKTLFDILESASKQSGEIKGVASKLSNLNNRGKRRQREAISFREIRNDSSHPNKNINYEIFTLVKNRLLGKNGILDEINSLFLLRY